MKRIKEKRGIRRADHQSHERRWDLFKSYIGWEDFIAIGLITLGVLGFFEPFIRYVPHIADFYLDIRSELIGIGITVLIIDNVNEMYRRRAEKERLILQMGSPNNSYAIEAIRQLRLRKWLTDGSLRNAYLIGADMSMADLSQADLRGAELIAVNLNMANLMSANLSDTNLEYAKLIETYLQDAVLTGAILKGVDLSRAVLGQAHLSHANLYRANLTGANLCGAVIDGAFLDEVNLTNADLSGIKMFYVDYNHDYLSEEAAIEVKQKTNNELARAYSLKGAIMPDGEVYDPAIHTDIVQLRREVGLDDGNS
jgi:uncharacterized protein YjbI with pentapeptide repeats